MGWLDLVALRHFTRLNSVTHLAITKLDVLTGVGDIGFTVAYQGPGGAEFQGYPYHQSILHKATPVVHRVPGWDDDIARDVNAGTIFPAAARSALEFISECVGLPIAVLSVGPERDQTLWSTAGVATACSPRRGGGDSADRRDCAPARKVAGDETQGGTDFT